MIDDDKRREEEELTAEEPVAEPTAEEPEEEPAQAEPAIEEPEEEPVQEESAAEEPEEESAQEESEEEPVQEEPIIEEPEEESVQAEPAIEEPEEESVQAEPAIEEPEEEFVQAEPVIEESAQEESAAGESPAELSVETAPEQEPAQENKTNKARRKHPIRNLLLKVLVVLLIIYGYFAYRYSTHFWANTYINGLNVSECTVSEAEELFTENAENYSLTILFRGEQSEVLAGSDFAYHVRLTSRFGDILASQSPLAWVKGYLQDTRAQISIRTTYDEEALENVIGELSELQSEQMTAPEDAYITFDRSQSRFVIVPETEGTVIDREALIAAVNEAVSQNQTELDLTALDGIYTNAEITSDNEDLNARLETLNKYTTASITFRLPSGEEMLLNAEVTKNWLAEDENGNLYMDEERWKEQIVLYVDEIAAKVNTVGKDRSFRATNIGTITVSGGDYGYSVNKVKEIEEIEIALENGEVLEREPYFYQTEFGDDRETNDGIGDTYIEVNLSAQHAWIYKDGVNVCDTDFVSGNTSLGRGTPTGNFQILYKDTDVDLKGQRLADGQYSYISHVNYWMPFYDGCGFHDANWRSSFGGSIYRTNGSHGCVNLPPSITPTFYSYVEPSMPVIVFY